MAKLVLARVTELVHRGVGSTGRLQAALDHLRMVEAAIGRSREQDRVVRAFNHLG